MRLKLYNGGQVILDVCDDGTLWLEAEMNGRLACGHISKDEAKLLVNMLRRGMRA